MARIQVGKRGNRSDGAHLTDLIGLIYRAAANEVPLTEMLTRLKDLYDGQVAILFLHEYHRNTHRFAVTVGLDIVPYNAYYSRINPWVKAQEAMPGGTVVLSQQLLAKRDFLRSEFYNDFLRPNDLKFALGSNVLKDHGTALKLGIIRSPRRGAFNSHERDLFTQLMPHLQSAFRLRSRLAALECTNQALSAAIDRLPIGVVFLDQRVHILEMNAMARCIFGQCDGLYVNHCNQVAANAAREDASLQRLLHGAVGTACGGADGKGGGVLSVSRTDGRRPHSVLVAPLCANTVEYPSGAHAIMFICDPHRQLADLEGRLRTLYNLTPAESCLALHVVNGLSLLEAAEKMGIAESTARIVSKRIYAKTETSGQAALVRLLLTSVLPLVVPSAGGEGPAVSRVLQTPQPKRTE